jgi:5-methylcytosine-specific restriction enzyme A
MPSKVCVARRCPRLTVPGKSRCVIHAAEQPKQNRSPFNSFYASKPWRLARSRQLFDHPLCQYKLDGGDECGMVADSVHHIVELRDGGAPRDPDNLMSVCRSHHSVIHAQRRGRVA